MGMYSHIMDSMFVSFLESYVEIPTHDGMVFVGGVLGRWVWNGILVSGSLLLKGKV